jgi:hypothetical protein
MAIPQRVWAIVVDAIEGQTERRIAHVGVEIFKAKPVFADGNAATAVIGVSIVFWIKTAL